MVYVISIEGKPLMPCKEAKARHLLRDGKAKVVRKEPFTVQLLFPCDNIVQGVTLGVDVGSKHVGLSAVSDKKELFSAEVELRNDVSKKLAARLEFRRARRNRKTRYRKPRFDNRVHAKKKGWLAPSVLHKVETHIRLVEKVCKILPVSKIVIETASFDIQKIKNPNIQGEEYQQGAQLGFWNVREYVLFRDGHTCQCCKGKSRDKVLNVHHIESRKTGGNAPNNLITLCETCHKKYHNGEIKLPKKIHRGMKFNDAVFMGIMRWTLYNRLKEQFGKFGIVVKNTYGYITKYVRIQIGLSKTHSTDAFCITGNVEAERLSQYWFIKQVRRHNRQLFKLNPLKGGIWKPNQAPYLVKRFRLFDKVSFNGQVGFIFGRRSSGSFDIRRLDGTKISPCAGYKKLTLLVKRKMLLIKRKEQHLIPMAEARGFRC